MTPCKEENIQGEEECWYYDRTVNMLDHVVT